jgi:PAS domain S-box-containing protein
VQLAKTTRQAADSVVYRIAGGLNTRIRPLERMARRWEIREKPAQQEWESDASLFASAFTGYQGIEWVDRSYAVRWVVPSGGSQPSHPLNLAEQPRARAALDLARQTRATIISGTFTLDPGGKGFAICVPIFRGAKSDGFIVGVFAIRELLHFLLDEYLPPEYSVAVYDGNQRIYARNTSPADRGEVGAEVRLQLSEVPWRVRLSPTPARLQEARSSLPRIVLLTGFGMGLMLSITVYMAQKARLRSREFESANLALENEVRERQKSAEALRQLNERLEAVIQASPLAIVALDLEGNIRSWNPTAERMFGWKEQEVINHHIPSVHGVEVDDFDALVARAAHGEPLAGVESRGRRKDGSSFEAAVWAAPLRDAGGAISGIMGILADISERKRLEEQLRQSQKMEAVGLLAGGIAHDFNNLLTAIMGSASLAAETMPAGSPAKEVLKTALEASERAADLVRQLLAYSGKGRFVIEQTHLSHLIQEMSHLLEISVSKKVILRLNLDPDLPAIQADRSQIQQLLRNLVINAAEAIGDDAGSVVITTGTRQIGPAEAEGFGGFMVPHGSYVTLEIADTGCGMDEETKSQIFDPFFTTKFLGRGLGLAAVVGIVRGHLGGMQVASAPGQGSTFTIVFPVAEEQVTKCNAAGAAGTARMHPGTAG